MTTNLMTGSRADIESIARPDARAAQPGPLGKPFYRITGGQPLSGAVSVRGAKNAVGKQLVATLLTEEPCVLTNVPKITEIDVMLEMLGDVGARSQWLDESTLEIETGSISSVVVSQAYSGFNRIPILMLGALLNRAHEVVVPAMGGCKIGGRPVDFHLSALQAMGAEISETDEGYVARSTGLRGTKVSLPYPSVGATENILLAAVLAKGTTVIENAAVEPEIVDVILFLQKMGASILVDVDRRIIVEGVDRLHGARHHALTDRMEAASFAVAAIATDGDVLVRGAQQENMISFLNYLRKAGGEFEVSADGIRFFRRDAGIVPVHIETDVHPGFMTDWQQPFVVMMTRAHGTSTVHETVHDSRFAYTEAIRGMGADIALTSVCLGHRPCRFRHRDFLHSCIVRGPTRLRAAEIEIPDLRAGFGFLVAALIADGTTDVHGIRYVERGYASVPEKLRELGASIAVVDG